MSDKSEKLYALGGGEFLFIYRNNNGTTYEWDFGDRNTGSGELASHEYPSAGTYLTTFAVDETNQRAIDISIFGNSFQVGKPASISDTVPAYYLTLQEAYDNAEDSNTLHSKDTTIKGDIFSMDMNIFF